VILTNNLMQQPEWIEDATGKITGYKTPGGADTVFPFSTKLTLYGTYTGDTSVGISDDLVDKNFIIVPQNCRIVINAGDPSGTGEFTFSPAISKSGNTLSVTGCSGTKVGVIKSLNAHWYVTYSIYYY